jgi:tRNA (cytidine/uridine-2'-O-)-methyltransferase
MRLALFQPDIPQNTGTMMRLCACLNVPMDIIEPCGFALSDKNLQRAGMDYLDHLDLTRHMNWQSFRNTDKTKRIILLTTKAQTRFTDFAFQADDTLLVGRESAGVPDDVHDACDQRIIIPMAGGVRSINVAVAAAMVLSEALRQTGLFPEAKAPNYG